MTENEYEKLNEISQKFVSESFLKVYVLINPKNMGNFYYPNTRAAWGVDGGLGIPNGMQIIISMSKQFA